MKVHPPALSMEERFAALEARITELEQQCEVAQLNIPWHVICAAIAAVMPNVKIIEVTPVSPNTDGWQTSAKLQNLYSHKVR